MIGENTKIKCNAKYSVFFVSLFASTISSKPQTRFSHFIKPIKFLNKMHCSTCVYQIHFFIVHIKELLSAIFQFSIFFANTFPKCTGDKS